MKICLSMNEACGNEKLFETQVLCMFVKRLNGNCMRNGLEGFLMMRSKVEKLVALAFDEKKL